MATLSSIGSSLWELWDLQDEKIMSHIWDITHPDGHYLLSVRVTGLIRSVWTLVDTWHTKKAHKRLFAANWAWIETNGMLAYNRQNPHARLTKQQWFRALAEACVNNPFKPHVPRVIPAVQEHGGPVSSCNGSCWVCKKVTKRKCKCGRPVCGTDTRAPSGRAERPQARECYQIHLNAVFDGEVGHTGRHTTRRGPGPQG